MFRVSSIIRFNPFQDYHIREDLSFFSADALLEPYLNEFPICAETFRNRDLGYIIEGRYKLTHVRLECYPKGYVEDRCIYAKSLTFTMPLCKPLSYCVEEDHLECANERDLPTLATPLIDGHFIVGRNNGWNNWTLDMYRLADEMLDVLCDIADKNGKQRVKQLEDFLQVISAQAMIEEQ